LPAVPILAGNGSIATALHILDFSHPEHANDPSITVQEKVDAAYRDKARWTRMSILSSAGMGKFSTDRTIAEYARDIWKAEPCVVPVASGSSGNGNGGA
jgi:hypothetical protein